MDDSLRGILVTVTIIGLFITCILNFLVLFPEEQGVTFSGQDQQGYLMINTTRDLGTVSSLENINNQSTDAFNQWDVTTGFMGTNQLKQGQGGISTMISNTFSSLIRIATELFTANSPVVYSLLVLSTLAVGYLIYIIIKFVRSGN